MFFSPFSSTSFHIFTASCAISAAWRAAATSARPLGHPFSIRPLPLPLLLLLLLRLRLRLRLLLPPFTFFLLPSP